LLHRFPASRIETSLRRRLVRTIVPEGAAANFGVESATRAAFDRGCGITFAEDAMSSVAAEVELQYPYVVSLDGQYPQRGPNPWRLSIAARLGSIWEHGQPYAAF
jgi:Isochorismatase family